MDTNKIQEIELKLQYAFNNKQLLEQAFTHSSYANLENVADNERMEFFGDAILEYVTSEYLFTHFSKSSEGELSAMRAKLVSADGLYPIVDKLGLMPYLLVANNSGANGELSHKIAANLFEAILCAIYLDGNLDSAREFVLRVMGASLQNAASTLKKDSKTLLQEYCQKNKLSIEYRSVGREGPDNKPIFRNALYIDGKLVSDGEGASKKAAEQDAAHKIVTKWRID